jgi:serine/threonine protein kinase
MKIMIGQTISHYKILEKLGEGGMGVVYKAQDTTLDRMVALKFLPPHMSSSEQDKARFIQEARAAAALNHPNICTIHGIEEHDGQMFIAMEFVEGHTLRDKSVGRSGDSPIQLKQAIEIGIQLADGLAAAHEKGIVHRDLKPENIMLQKDGRVRIMDFGLAKLKGASRLTKAGSTVGTAGYMSPEQVQGLETDHRTDIFSLGVLLYELFAGVSPFKGVHETAVNYEIVNVDPQPISSLKPDFDPQLDAIVLECLPKEPGERSQSAAEVAKDLRHAKRESSKSRLSRVTTVKQAYRPSGDAQQLVREDEPRNLFDSRRLPWFLTTALLAGLIVVSWMALRPSPAEVFPIKAFIPAPENTNYHSYGVAAGPVIVSPNGRLVAFVASTRDGRTMLYVRSLDETTAKPLPGTEGSMYPFWSPDSRWIGFFTGFGAGKLKKIDVAGGPPVTICDAQNARGGTWNADGTIVFAPNATGPIHSVAASGGALTPVTSIDSSRNESSHRWPSFLPDGKHFLYFSRTISFGAEAEGDAIFIGSIDRTVNKLLIASPANAMVASGHLLFIRGNSLLAQPLDLGNLELKGEPVTLASGIINDPGFSLAVFSASQNGILAFQTGEGLAGARLAVVDRTGNELGFIGDVIEHYSPRLSPDGQRIVCYIFEPKSRTQNLWVYDLTRGSRTRLTSGLSSDINPVWSPDGKRVAYTKLKGETFILQARPASGVGTEETLLESSVPTVTADWSRDGRFIALERLGRPSTQGDIWILPLEGEKKPFSFLQTAFLEGNPRFSPDGRLLAYTSNETGQFEVFLRPFPGPGTGVKVSVAGGHSPSWSRDPGELFYISQDNKMMRAEIVTRGGSLEVGRVQELFVRTPIMSDYDPFPDGKRFLINRQIEPKETDPITIVVNWDAGTKKK